MKKVRIPEDESLHDAFVDEQINSLSRGGLSGKELMTEMMTRTRGKINPYRIAQRIEVLLR